MTLSIFETAAKVQLGIFFVLYILPLNEFVRQWIEALNSTSMQKYPLITLTMDLLSLAQGGQHSDWLSNLLSKISLSDSILLSQRRNL